MSDFESFHPALESESSLIDDGISIEDITELGLSNTTEAVKGKLIKRDKTSLSGHEEKTMRSEQMDKVKNKTLEKEDIEDLADQKREKSDRTIETSRLLNTKDLPQLTDEQAKMIIQVFEENPDIEIENSVTHEVATTLSFETIDTKKLSKIAVKMRHNNTSGEMFDLQQATNPKEKFFFASLAALVEAYNGSDQNLPQRGFKNLSGDEMTALHDSFLFLISEKYPHLNLDTNYKITEMKTVASSFLGAMNFIREKEDTDLFSKVSLVSNSSGKHANETKDDLFDLYDDFKSGQLE